MRIIGGKYKSRRIQVPSNLKARPTTDFAKEGLFNVLNNLLDWEKYEHNPIIAGNCRWPTVVFCDSIFYMFYAEYKHPDGDSRVVMAENY